MSRAPKKPATATTKKTTSKAKPVTPAVAKGGAADKPQPVDLGPALRKKELIETITSRSGLKKRDVKLVVENTLAVLGEALRDDRELILPPMGKVQSKRAKKIPGGRVVIAKLRQNDAASDAPKPVIKAVTTSPKSG